MTLKKVVSKRFFAFSRPIESFFKFGEEIHFVWKDLNSTFLGCSDFLATEAGVTLSALVGLDDRDLIWGDRATQYRDDEKLVLESNATRCIHEKVKTLVSDGDDTFLTFKTPMIDSAGFVSGIFCISFNSKQSSLFELTNWINQLGILVVNSMLLPVPNQTVMQRLSKREQECLYHLTHGKTTKEIASLIECSYRTVEVHIDNMKLKLDSRTRSELISKAQYFQ